MDARFKVICVLRKDIGGIFMIKKNTDYSHINNDNSGLVLGD